MTEPMRLTEQQVEQIRKEELIEEIRKEELIEEIELINPWLAPSAARAVMDKALVALRATPSLSKSWGAAIKLRGAVEKNIIWPYADLTAALDEFDRTFPK